MVAVLVVIAFFFFLVSRADRIAEAAKRLTAVPSASPAAGPSPAVVRSSLSGRWIQPGGPDVYDLTQIGDALEGSFRYADGGQGTLAGEVKQGGVRFRKKGIFRNGLPFTADVSLTADESRTTLAGTIIYRNDANRMEITLRRL